MALENNQVDSSHGGARKGAGRKTGSATKRTREIADKAAASGVTPLDVMLDNMVFAHSHAATLLGKLLDAGAEVPDGFDSLKELLRYRTLAQEAAKDAAPYIHPKLQAIEHTGKDGGPLETISRIELVALK